MQHAHYDRILGILCSVLDAHSAVLFLPLYSIEDNKTPTYCIASAFSLGDKLNYDADIQEGRGLVGWILRNNEPLRVDNFDQRRNHLGYYTDNEELSIKAFMGCSLPGSKGALCLDSKRQYSFAEKDQKMLHLFAELLAQLELDNRDNENKGLMLKYYAALRTVYALRRQYSRWTEFLRHFLDLMATMTGFAYCVLCTRDPEGTAYSIEGENIVLMQRPGVAGPSFPMTHGIIGWVFRNASQVCSDGPDGSPETLFVGKGVDIPHFQTVLALPLIIQRKTRGVLCLAHDLPMEINGATQDFARMASEHLALFLENLYVKCRLRDLHRQTQVAEGLETSSDG
ncbi:MAG: GAF domain-containing protein [Desulfovibrio sp.]|jgi:transcriptional regulator with GAF, ATPase, and Fis domain|nr:GAF domain-containing protein [Desulfovibrio sp.]